MSSAGRVDPPGLDEVLRNSVGFRVPLTTRFRGVTDRSGMLLEGPAGWGEFAPFGEYPPALAARWLAAAVEAAYLGLPTPRRRDVPVNAIIPAVAAEQAASMARVAVVDHGVHTIKVKVGRDAGPSAPVDSSAVAAVALAADCDRLAAIRGAVGKSVQIRVDVNARWSPGEAPAALRRLDEAAGGVEYVEQPLARLVDLIDLRARVGVPLAVDESLRLAADPFDPHLHEQIRRAADVVVFKPIPLGGVRRTLLLAELIGLPAVISGSMDTSVGLASPVAAAAALPDDGRAHGLGTGALLADDLVAVPWRPVSGTLSVMTPHPDPDAVQRARERVSPAEQLAWRERLRQAWSAGTPALLADRS